MEIFALAGSGDQIARTSVSLVLALGLARRGLKPLHIQVLDDEDAAPVLSRPEHAPFTSLALAPGDAGPTGSGILQRALAHGDLGPVVVDLPGRDVPTRLLGHRHCNLLLPMATHRPELKRSAQDFAWLAARRSPFGSRNVFVVPVGWPSVLRQADYQRLLKREAARAAAAMLPAARHIVPRGISDVILGLGPLLIDGAVNSERQLAHEAAVIAQAVLRSTGSSWIESDPTRDTSGS
ncbi:hypothetical protein [Bosea sp. BH3]|uniref:hypothetical protein n=1 Tax=Bosea sp. BH3 TaxID=2871701 RepID=UPI0021CAF5C1|nr:hypothetical protein [Bosea sp. BH3]MCU4180180.1 hypothetical protein [Bosea sp. BH3]